MSAPIGMVQIALVREFLQDIQPEFRRSWADDNLLERRHRLGAVVDGRADLVQRIGV